MSNDISANSSQNNGYSTGALAGTALLAGAGGAGLAYYLKPSAIKGNSPAATSPEPPPYSVSAKPDSVKPAAAKQVQFAPDEAARRARPNQVLYSDGNGVAQDAPARQTFYQDASGVGRPTPEPQSWGKHRPATQPADPTGLSVISEAGGAQLASDRSATSTSARQSINEGGFGAGQSAPKQGWGEWAKGMFANLHDPEPLDLHV